MEKGNNFRIFCSKTAFENRKIIIETISNNYVLEKTRQESNARRALSIFVANVYRTISKILINGPQVQKFVHDILIVLQSWAEQKGNRYL